MRYCESEDKVLVNMTDVLLLTSDVIEYFRFDQWYRTLRYRLGNIDALQSNARA
jgi:hypothetical protein